MLLPNKCQTKHNPSIALPTIKQAPTACSAGGPFPSRDQIKTWRKHGERHFYAFCHRKCSAPHTVRASKLHSCMSHDHPHTSKQASKQASKQESKQASKQANNIQNLVSNVLSTTAPFSERRTVWKQIRSLCLGSILRAPTTRVHVNWLNVCMALKCLCAHVGCPCP